MNISREYEELSFSTYFVDQPETIQDEISSLEEGLQEILQQLEQATAEEKSESSQFFQFFDAMTVFTPFARVELDRIVSEWAAFENSSEAVLVAFGGNSDSNSPIKDLWGHFYTFSKKFKESLEDRDKQLAENERLKRIHEYWMREGKNNRDLEEIDGSKKESVENPETFGLMDKLISSIKQGHFAV